jgi:MATE family multidrug resistance protein
LGTKVPIPLHPVLRFFRTYRREMKQALRLAYPIILGQVGIMLMGVADTVMVGNLGREVLAASVAANNIFWLIYFLGMGILFAISPLVAIYSGEGRPEKGYLSYRAGIWVTVGLSVVLFALLEGIISNIGWLRQSKEVEPLAASYLRIVNFSGLPMLLFVSSRQFTDGLGFTKVAMYITGGGLLLNVFLNWVLINGNLGCTALGLDGAGYATLISRVIMAIAAMAYIRYAPSMKSYHPEQRFSTNEIREEAGRVFEVGLPIGLQFFAEVACFAFSGIMAGWVNATHQSAHGIALNLASLTYMAASGLSAAGSIMAGNAYGEKNRRKVRRAGNAVMAMVLLYMLATAVLFLLFRGPLARAYTDDAQVIGVATVLLIYAALFQLADGVQAVSLGLLRGIKDVRIPSIALVVFYWVVGLPLGWWLGFGTGMKTEGIWIGFTVGLFLTALFASARFYLQVKKI